MSVFDFFFALQVFHEKREVPFTATATINTSSATACCPGTSPCDLKFVQSALKNHEIFDSTIYEW